ncbi:MAG: hypothetical protein JXR70_04285 [Spirochaetales bacterium]|nr:hypothetical protein [Spirochaetales bacterium]
MKKCTLIIGIFFSCVLVFAETYFSGKFTSSVYSYINSDQISNSTIGDRTSLNFTIGDESDNYSFLITPEIDFSYTEKLIEPRLKEWALKIDLFTFLSIKTGFFPYLPGMAEFFSNTNFYTISDYEELVSGNFQNSMTPSTLIQLQFFTDQWYLFLTCSPFLITPILPDPASPWFPTKNLPPSISISEPINQTINLGSIIIQDIICENSLSNANYGFELGGGFSYFDFSLSYFHGQNNFPLFTSTMEFPEGLNDYYNIILTPLWENIDAFGLDIKTTLNAMTFWLDAAYYPWKPYQSRKLDTTNFSTLIKESPSIISTLGMGYEIQTPHISLLIEYKKEWILINLPEIVTPDFANLLTINLRLFLHDDKIIFYPVVLLSTLDQSWATIFNFTFAPEYFFECFFTLPLFFGKEKSDFGQYRKNIYGSMGFTYRL